MRLQAQRIHRLKQARMDSLEKGYQGLRTMATEARQSENGGSFYPLLILLLTVLPFYPLSLYIDLQIGGHEVMENLSLAFES
jgi:hypothetical protein